MTQLPPERKQWQDRLDSIIAKALGCSASEFTVHNTTTVVVDFDLRQLMRLVPEWRHVAEKLDEIEAARAPKGLAAFKDEPASSAQPVPHCHEGVIQTDGRTICRVCGIEQPSATPGATTKDTTP